MRPVIITKLPLLRLATGKTVATTVHLDNLLQGRGFLALNYSIPAYVLSPPQAQVAVECRGP
jgi:hypothetical protein